MKTKDIIPSALFGHIDDSLIQFYTEYNHLKQLYRQGWLRFVPEDKCESVADHAHGVALLAMLLSENYPELNREKVISMALIHDVVEVHAGDITPHDGISYEDQQSKETIVFKALFKSFPKKYVDLWNEFVEQKTSEAKFVKQIDKLEMALQAMIYSKQGYSGMDEFFKNAEKHMKDPELVRTLKTAETLAHLKNSS